MIETSSKEKHLHEGRLCENFPFDRFFLKFLWQSGNELLVTEMQKKLGVTDFISEIKHVENSPDFDKLAHVIQHGLQSKRSYSCSHIL